MAKSKPKNQKADNKVSKEQYYKEIDDLYCEVSRRFGDCEEEIFAAQDAIGYSNLARATKTRVLKKFQEVWAGMNEIVDTIGRIGKVR